MKVSTSVVAKRVTQLENQVGIALFHRSTRQLRLTEAGQQYVHRARGVVADVGDLLSRMGEKDHDLIDHLRIKAPTSLTIARLADVFSAFQTENPRLKLEVVLIDRPVDPVTEGFDVAIGAFPHSFGGVVDEPLCALKRLLCAAPAYLKSHGVPRHPRDLVEHRCLSFLPTGPEWIFDGPRGRITIQVRPLLSSNEGHVLVKGAIAERHCFHFALSHGECPARRVAADGASGIPDPRFVGQGDDPRAAGQRGGRAGIASAIETRPRTDAVERTSALVYSYTIGTGGSSVMRLLADHLAPRLIGRDADQIEAIWHDLEFATHATTIGAITAIAIAAIDTALWDLRAKKQDLPLWKLAGGAKERCPLYTTEGGWLHIDTQALVDDAVSAKAQGFRGCKVKIGKPHGAEDLARLSAVRKAVGDDYEIMTDCNQVFTVDEAIRRAARLRELDLAWIEEPLPADDIDGHVRLSRSTPTPIAIGELLYSIRHFREYMQKGACSIVQVDVGRIGGITPWLKVAHAAEAFDIPVCPHFLMELHVSLACAVQNGRYVEYIPQLDGSRESACASRTAMRWRPKTRASGSTGTGTR